MDPENTIDFGDGDIYTLTFIKMLNSDSSQLHRELALKSIMTFLMQILLVILIRSESLGFSGFHLGDVQMNLTRLICGVLLHTSVMPEIRTAL